MQLSKLIAIVLIGGALAAQSVQAKTVASSSSSSSKGGTNTSLAFVGGNGNYAAGDDKIVVKNGVITINGVSYGKVSERSQIQYNIRDGKKTLTVDGAPRAPIKPGK